VKKLENLQIQFAVFWIACMLTYFLGDVIRIFSGNFTAGEMGGNTVANWMWILTAGIMVIPIIMIVVSILLPVGPLSCWLNLIFAVGFILFNLLGIAIYKAFDVFLLIISFGFNCLIIFFAVKQLWF
jgi:hypothetical protein